MSSILHGAAARMRNLLILQKKLTTGMNNQELAADFGISRMTIERSLKAAIRATDVEKFEAELFKELVPQAMTTAKTAMVNGNAQVAIEILKGAGILKKQTEKSSGGANSDGDDLELYIRAKRNKLPSNAPNGAGLLPQVGALVTGLLSPAQTAPSLQPVDGLSGLPGIPTVVEHPTDSGSAAHQPVDYLEGRFDREHEPDGTY